MSLKVSSAISIFTVSVCSLETALHNKNLLSDAQ